MNMYANTYYILRNIVKTHNFIQTVLMIIYKSCFKRLILSLQYSYLWYTDTEQLRILRAIPNSKYKKPVSVYHVSPLHVLLGWFGSQQGLIKTHWPTIGSTIPTIILTDAKWLMVMWRGFNPPPLPLTSPTSTWLSNIYMYFL